MEGNLYFVTLSFVHNVVIESITQFQNGENCTANSNASKTVNISCSDLLYATSYTLSVRGTANLEDDSICELAFTAFLNFITEDKPVTTTELAETPTRESVTIESSSDTGQWKYETVECILQHGIRICSSHLINIFVLEKNRF